MKSRTVVDIIFFRNVPFKGNVNTWKGPHFSQILTDLRGLFWSGLGDCFFVKSD